MKTFRLENSDIEKDDYIGAVHSIIEALYTVLRDKSWENIISIGVDPVTFEGIVEYEDRLFEGNLSDNTEKYSLIHEECYKVACVVDKYLDLRFNPNKDLFHGFLWGYIEELYEMNYTREIILKYAFNCVDYIDFIEEIANHLTAGKSFSREEIEKKFSEMGFTFK